MNRAQTKPNQGSPDAPSSIRLTVRVPIAVHAALKAQARACRRSLSDQAGLLLEREVEEQQARLARMTHQGVAPGL